MDLQRYSTLGAYLALAAAVALACHCWIAPTAPPARAQAATLADDPSPLVTVTHQDGTCLILNDQAEATVKEGDVLQVTGSDASCCWFDPETDVRDLAPGEQFTLSKRETGYLVTYHDREGRPAFLTLIF